MCDPLIRCVPVGGTSEEEGGEEEEAAEEEDREDDPDYRGSEESGSEGSESEEEGGSDESSDPAELTREEEEYMARRKQEKAKGKHLIKELQEPPPQLLQGDPALSSTSVRHYSGVARDPPGLVTQELDIDPRRDTYMELPQAAPAECASHTSREPLRQDRSYARHDLPPPCKD
ncbi:hypothetical protein CBR_g11029 [Chara braunii]|uniref:Uncharacterized protein n=1 Tax=Chara braunii TaxID=69332 RepID=A0A388KPX4_CHABU|nr:hypothetical protein CBR_g11029 [Chara braunii]|eukprot:GBG72096.1 hypothetical protein CBR_g11029 [Chara braunii]